MDNLYIVKAKALVSAFLVLQALINQIINILTINVTFVLKEHIVRQKRVNALIVYQVLIVKKKRRNVYLVK